MLLTHTLKKTRVYATCRAASLGNEQENERAAIPKSWGHNIEAALIGFVEQLLNGLFDDAFLESATYQLHIEHFSTYSLDITI